MKIRILILCLLLFSCKGEQHNEQDFKWLLGDWHRINEAEGLKTFESWKKNSEMEYEGFGFTLKKSDTVFQERMLLKKNSDKWQFIVTGVNEQPTVFHVMSIDKSRFIAENPRNVFPKKITYFQNVNSLNALISGEEKTITYKFEKMQHPSEIKESILNMFHFGF